MRSSSGIEVPAHQGRHSTKQTPNESANDGVGNVVEDIAAKAPATRSNKSSEGRRKGGARNGLCNTDITTNNPSTQSDGCNKDGGCNNSLIPVDSSSVEFSAKASFAAAELSTNPSVPTAVDSTNYDASQTMSKDVDCSCKTHITSDDVAGQPITAYAMDERTGNTASDNNVGGTCLSKRSI